ncbi:hypothetical protein [Kutzneria sp. CA-103260]|uniref:hypothetical protein n=1 Tax=Kutzneria sp. CA-103260 TaxID=2802641 RepID=UPI001BA82DE8|nr:hypothetical protein [Kutzneria sp. CA-103260]
MDATGDHPSRHHRPSHHVSVVGRRRHVQLTVAVDVLGVVLILWVPKISSTQVKQHADAQGCVRHMIAPADNPQARMLLQEQERNRSGVPAATALNHCYVTSTVQPQAADSLFSRVSASFGHDWETRLVAK